MNRSMLIFIQILFVYSFNSRRIIGHCVPTWEALLIVEVVVQSSERCEISQSEGPARPTLTCRDGSELLASSETTSSPGSTPHLVYTQYFFQILLQDV